MKIEHVETRLACINFGAAWSDEHKRKLAEEMASRLPSLGVAPKERVTMRALTATWRGTEKVTFPDHWQSALWRFGNQALELSLSAESNCRLDIPMVCRDGLKEFHAKLVIRSEVPA
jgi:hypothetical protein